MIEAKASSTPTPETPGLVLPGIWWHLPVHSPGFVEIALPPQETQEILADAQYAFPRLATAALRLVSEQGEIPLAEWRSNPQIAQGLLNMLVLMFAINWNKGEPGTEQPRAREALRAAFRGRIKIQSDVTEYPRHWG